jgi:hypothetical protein
MSNDNKNKKDGGEQLILQINHIYHNRYFDLTFIVIGKEYDAIRKNRPMYKVKFLNHSEEGYDIKLYSQQASLFHENYTVEI